MDLNKLNQGEKIAGVAGIILLISLWLAWYGGGEVNGVEIPDAASASGWEALSLIDIIVFITAVAAIAAAVMSGTEGDAGLPVAMSAVVTALGALSVLLILFRIIDVPVGDLPDGLDVDIGRKFGIFVALLAAAGVTYGGYTAMQEEGTSFSDQGR